VAIRSFGELHPKTFRPKITVGQIGGIMQRTFGRGAALAGLSLMAGWMAFGQSGATAKTVEISAKKYEFSPAEIHVKAGEKVELKVHSVDETHGVKLSLYPEGAKDKKTPGLVFDTPEENGKVTKGTDQVLDFVAKEPGTYDFVCAKFCGFGHDKMKGKLIVEP
jgi:cytochrome c oxidase subunit II